MQNKSSLLSFILPLVIVGCGGGGSSDTRDKTLDTKISGVVYEDENRNGKKDDTEKGTDKVKLTITDAKGTEYIVSTNVNGEYQISKIEGGMATITIDKNTLPSDATLSGKNIMEYDVQPFVTNPIEPIAYTLPVITGEVESTEQNVTDENGTLTVDVEVVIIDENNETNVTIIEAGDTLPDNNDTNITNISIKVGEVHGRIFLDYDESYDYSTGEEGLAGIDVTITDMSGAQHHVVTDDRGIYSAQNIPVGDATVQVDDDKTVDAIAALANVEKAETIDGLRDGRSTQNFIKDANVTVTVEQGNRNEAEDIGYFATSAKLGIVFGTIFFDDNTTGILGAYDDNDTRLVGITVTVKDSQGITHTTESRDDIGHAAYKGTYQVAVPPGEVTIIVDRNDTDLPSYKNTIGNEVDKDIAEIGKITYVGGFGFTDK